MVVPTGTVRTRVEILFWQNNSHHFPAHERHTWPLASATLLEPFVIFAETLISIRQMMASSYSGNRVGMRHYARTDDGHSSGHSWSIFFVSQCTIITLSCYRVRFGNGTRLLDIPSPPPTVTALYGTHRTYLRRRLFCLVGFSRTGLGKSSSICTRHLSF